MSVFIGIDIGSRNTKLVAFDAVLNKILHSAISESGVNSQHTVKVMFEQTLDVLQLTEQDVSKIYTTGYGRKVFKTDKTVSEIRCHAMGVQFYVPEVKTIIDIGGQDSKLISLDENKHIKDFIMNDKCAAGTGRFLEMVALRLGVRCEELSNLASFSRNKIHLTNTCVVFAESEIVGMIAEGASSSDLARAVNVSIAERITAQLNQLGCKPPVVFTGGVALNSDLGDLISKQIGNDVLLPPHPEITGALGAAIIAARDVG
jgi:predicted CoA-substrate-specific enzyme activase